MSQIEIEFAKRVTDEAIERVERATTRKNPDWIPDCLEYFRIWLERRREDFQMEEFRNHCRNLLAPPTHERVYGTVVRKASLHGWIQYVGTRPVSTPRNHRANAAVWRSLLVKR